MWLIVELTPAIILVLIQSITTTGEQIHPTKAICPFENVSISALIDPPYVVDSNVTKGIISEFIIEALRTCFDTKICRGKIRHLQWRSLYTQDELSQAVKKKQSDLVFPVPPSLRSRRRQTVNYYPVITTPGLALIVNYHACKKIAGTLLSTTVSSVWPILVFSLLMAGIMGVLIWAMEHRHNNKQFSKPFVRGSYDGFWWAVVSMTTVGYGNQVPSSLLGRLFSLLWILAGVTMVAIFTASITSAITVVSVQQSCKEIQGQLIAVLNESDAEEVARHRGAIVKGYNDVKPMFEDLKSQEIKGILMDRLKAYYYLNSKKDEGFRIAEVLEKKVEFSVAMVTGNITSLTSNDCFMDTLEEPRAKINKIMKRYIHPVKPLAMSNDTIGLFSSDSTPVRNALIALAVVLALLLLFGLTWDTLYQRHNCFRPTSIPNNVLTNVHDIPMADKRHGDEQITQLQTAITDLTEQIRVLKCQLQEAGITTYSEKN